MDQPKKEKEKNKLKKIKENKKLLCKTYLKVVFQARLFKRKFKKIFNQTIHVYGSTAQCLFSLDYFCHFD
jgi:hypothetical protein